MHERNMRLFLQSQAGLSETNGKVTARVEIPGEYYGNSVVLGQHTIARSSVLIIKPISHQRVRYYDPAHDGQRSILSSNHNVEPVAEVIDVVPEEETNLQGFNIKAKMSTLNPFADIGVVFEDEEVVAADEELDDIVKSNADLNAPSLVDPDVVYAELLDRGTKNYGISRDELGAFSLTLKQVKSLYQDVTGKAATNITSGKMKRRIRDLASQSYADYTRVINAIKKVLNK